MCFIQTKFWMAEHREWTFVSWVPGKELTALQLLAVLWLCSLSQLPAMWQSALLVFSANQHAFLFFFYSEWKGCKMHFKAASSVMHGALRCFFFFALSHCICTFMNKGRMKLQHLHQWKSPSANTSQNKDRALTGIFTRGHQISPA